MAIYSDSRWNGQKNVGWRIRVDYTTSSADVYVDVVTTSTTASIVLQFTTGTNTFKASSKTYSNRNNGQSANLLGTLSISPYSSYTITQTCSKSSWGGNVNGSLSVTIPQQSTPSRPTITRSVSDITRTSAKLNVSCSSNPYNYWKIHWYNVNGAWAGSSKNGETGNWSYSQSGLTANTRYNFYTQTTNNSDGEGDGLSPIGFTTSGNAPIVNSISVSNISRTSATLSISASYDKNARNSYTTYQYGTTTNYGSSTGASMTGLSPNTTYYVRGRVTDNWNRTSGWATNSFTTTGNAPSITSHGVQTYAQTTMTMKYSASYDTNDSLGSYKWDVGTSTSYGQTFSNTNSLSGLSPNTTYYYRLTVTSSRGRSSTATGSFKTDYPTQQVTSITIEDITDSSVGGIVNIPNPSWLTNLTIWIYEGDTLVNTITKSTDISASNSFLFEDLSPGTNYEIRARITTKTQNSSGGYNSNIKAVEAITRDSNFISIIKSDGTISRHKMYVMGKGNIYDPSVMGWQNGYYGTGIVGQSLSETLTQSTDTNGGAAASTTFIEILPNISYTITNDDTEVDFIIHGTDSSDVITTVGYTVSPGQSYVYEGTPDTNRLWVSIKSDTNPVVNYATAKFFKMNVFRTIEKTLIPKDNIVCLNGKIRYIDIIQAGNSIDTRSHIVALKVFDSSGEDIALNKTVTMIEGKDPLNLSRITDGNTETSDYAQISPKTSVNLETVVRVDLGEEHTDIDHVILWRYYADGRRYLNTKLYGRDATTKLTWKFQDFRSQGEYVETSEGYSSTVRREVIEGVPVILSVLQEPNNSTSTLVGTKITINADWLASVPPVLDSWISYRTDAILAANQGRLLKAEIGSLSGLTTTAKDSLVEAINEVYGGYDGSNEYTNILNAILNAVLNR